MNRYLLIKHKQTEVLGLKAPLSPISHPYPLSLMTDHKGAQTLQVKGDGHL